MSPGAEAIDEGLRDLEEVQGHPTFVYRGRHWACSGNKVASDLTQEPGGKMQDIGAIITIRKSAIFPVITGDQNEGLTGDSETDTGDIDRMPPHQGKLVLFKNRKLQIGRMLADTEAAWTIELVSPTRR